MMTAKKPDEKPDLKVIAKQVKELKVLSKKLDQLKVELSSVVAQVHQFDKSIG